MSETKICPHCGAVNEGLDLTETNGLYVCCNCNETVDTKTEKESWFHMDYFHICITIKYTLH